MRYRRRLEIVERWQNGRIADFRCKRTPAVQAKRKQTFRLPRDRIICCCAEFYYSKPKYKALLLPMSFAEYTASAFLRRTTNELCVHSDF
jgi:hypothetical protein